MVMCLEILVVILIVFLGLYVKHFIARRKCPPGPLGIPIFGGKPYRIIQFIFPKLFPSISEKEYFKEMKKKYGKIWSIDDGDKTIVVLASIDLVTEAFIDNGKLFSGRPSIEAFKIIGEDTGVVFSDGEVWQTNRQLAIKSLRDLGMGKQVLERQICEEVDDFIENIEKNSSKPIISPTIFTKAVSNIIANLVFNIRNKYEDPGFECFIKNIKMIGNTNEASEILEIFSYIIPKKLIRKIFPVVDILINSTNKCMEFMRKSCRERIKVESEFAKPSCVFDFFWRYRFQDQPEIKLEEKIHEIAHSMFDLFFGGTDTVNNILGFCFLFLGKDSELQNTLRKEIHSSVDDYKLINMEMRKKCPKLLSFLDEVFRFCPLDTLFFRRALSDCVFQGYQIKCNDTVYGDITAITRDPEHFDNPDVFNPYRFLDESRTKYIPSKSVISFGIGKRACLGESISRMELFLILSKIILKFDVVLPVETEKNVDKIIEGTSGIVHRPLNHEIILRSIESN